MHALSHASLARCFNNRPPLRPMLMTPNGLKSSSSALRVWSDLFSVVSIVLLGIKKHPTHGSYNTLLHCVYCMTCQSTIPVIHNATVCLANTWKWMRRIWELSMHSQLLNIDSLRWTIHNMHSNWAISFFIRSYVHLWPRNEQRWMVPDWWVTLPAKLSGKLWDSLRP